jgi:hypothetical protein
MREHNILAICEERERLISVCLDSVEEYDEQAKEVEDFKSETSHGKDV